MPIDPTIPKDNDLVSTLPASIRDARQAIVDLQSSIGYTVAGKENFHGVESYGTISFNNDTQTLSVASIKYWYKGTSYTSLTPITKQITGVVADRLYFFYWTDATGVLSVSTTPWTLSEHVLLATVNWNGTVGAVVRETHNHTRDLDWHANAHNTIGARYQAGLALVYPSTAVDNQINIGSGTIWDEDIRTDISNKTEARLWYKTATTYTFDSIPTTLPYKWNATTSRVQYLDTDTNTLADLATNQYTVVWVYASPDIDVPIWILVGEHADPYGTVAAARAAVPPTLSGSPVSPETKLIYRWIFKGDGQFEESSDYRQSASLPAGGAASTSAASVTFTPSGTIASANVQAALEELDLEKTSTAHDHVGGDGAQIAYSALSGLPTLDTMAAQNAATVAITGGTITGASVTVTDAGFILTDNVDPTKRAQFELSGISTGTTRTYTLPNTTGTLVDLATTQTINGAKTFSGTVAVTDPTITLNTAKTSVVDADEVVIRDSAATFSIKKLTWANVKAALKTWIEATTFAKTVPQSITANSTSAALTVTQVGTGNALVIEDSASPDTTPFMINADGGVGIGASPGNYKMYVTHSGTSNFSGVSIYGSNAAATDAAGLLRVFTNNNSSSNAVMVLGSSTGPLMSLWSSGSLLIGSTVNDGLNKLQVTGAATVSASFGIGTTTPATHGGGDLNCVTHGAGTVINKITSTTANTGQSRLDWTTATANSYAIASLADNNGTPFWKLGVGPAVTATYFDAPLHVWRSASGTEFARVSSSGLEVTGPAKATQWNVSAMATAPASATAAGTTGEVRVTATHIYVCTATNTWVRAALSTWT
jgi:hypothetical protein